MARSVVTYAIRAISQSVLARVVLEIFDSYLSLLQPLKSKDVGVIAAFLEELVYLLENAVFAASQH